MQAAIEASRQRLRPILFLTPVFYVLLRKLAGNRPLVEHGAHVAPISQAPHGGGMGQPVLAAPRKEHE